MDKGKNQKNTLPKRNAKVHSTTHNRKMLQIW